VEIAFDRNISDIDMLLQADPIVKEVTKQGDKYHIHTGKPSDLVKKIVQFAASNKLEILSMNTKQPSLEDAFVKYTGLDAVQLERMELLRAAKTGGQRG
jgi:elongation factor P--beta-lysine ligase